MLVKNVRTYGTSGYEYTVQILQISNLLKMKNVKVIIEKKRSIRDGSTWKNTKSWNQFYTANQIKVLIIEAIFTKKTI